MRENTNSKTCSEILRQASTSGGSRNFTPGERGRVRGVWGSFQNPFTLNLRFSLNEIRDLN